MTGHKVTGSSSSAGNFFVHPFIGSPMTLRHREKSIRRVGGSAGNTARTNIRAEVYQPVIPGVLNGTYGLRAAFPLWFVSSLGSL